MDGGTFCAVLRRSIAITRAHDNPVPSASEYACRGHCYSPDITGDLIDMVDDYAIFVVKNASGVVRERPGDPAGVLQYACEYQRGTGNGEGDLVPKLHRGGIVA